MWDGLGERVDLLLTDVIMPEVGGPELARRLRMRHSDLRVLFTSGYTEDETVARGLASASVGFLGKPFTPAELVEGVEAVLADGRA